MFKCMIHRLRFIACVGMTIAVSLIAIWKAYYLYVVYFGGNDGRAAEISSMIERLCELGEKLEAGQYSVKEVISICGAERLSSGEKNLHWGMSDMLKATITEWKENGKIGVTFQGNEVCRMPTFDDYYGYLLIQTNAHGFVSKCVINYGWR